MPVRWCLTKDEIALVRQEATNPYMLIVATRNTVEVARVLVPLEQMMDFVHFRQPGSHRVQAVVVWGSPSADVEKYFLDLRRRGEYSENVVDYRGQIRTDFDTGIHQFGSRAELEASISPEFFAQEPAEWERSWVNFFFGSPAVDQCHFRRRRIFAYTLQPLIFIALLIAMYLTVTLLTFFGLVLKVPRNAGKILEKYWNQIRHPLDSDFSDLWTVIRDGDSVFATDKDGKVQPGYIRFLKPWLVLTFSAASFLLGGITKVVLWELGFEWWKELSWFGAFLVGAGLAAGLIGTIAAIYLAWRAYFDQQIAEWRKAARAELEEERRRHLTLLACDIAGAARLGAIPGELRTIHLRFEDFKARVCRPFAR